MSMQRLSLAGALLIGALSYIAIDYGLGGGATLVLQVLLMVAAVIMIAHGADWLVDSACRIAQFLGVSHLVIGLTVVAFGTSAPEMAASLLAGFRGNGDIAVANVVGSNVFNLCFILGSVSALLSAGLKSDKYLIGRDAPVLLAGTALLFLFVGSWPLFGAMSGQPEAQVATATAAIGFDLLNTRLELLEGVVLLGCLVAYTVFLYRSKGGNKEELEAEQRMTMETFGVTTWRDLPQFVIGLVVVVGCCNILVGEAHVESGTVRGYGALWFARVWNVPDYVIGVTIIAAGTSAPEFVVSLVAAVRGAFGISAGNLVGSDIFNLFGVLGLSGILLQPPLAPTVSVSAAVVPSLLGFTLVVAVVWIFMRTGQRISRAEGVALVLLGMARWAFDFSY